MMYQQNNLSFLQPYTTRDTPGQMEKVGALASSKTLNYKTPGSNPGDVGTDASDKLYVPESGNVGFAKRHQFIKNGNRFVLSGPIFADIFMTDRLLLNMMDLKVVLKPFERRFLSI